MAKKGQKKKERVVGDKKGKSGESSSDDENAAGGREAKGEERSGKALLKTRGLANLGNTCFLNSILQCLNASVPFSNQLLSLSAKEGLSGVAASLCAVLDGVRSGGSNNKAVSPKPLLTQLVSKFPWYKGGEQQDAHELLRMLLGTLSDERTAAEKKQRKAESNDHPPSKPGIPVGECERAIWDSFRGQIYAAVLCWGCGRVSTRLEAFLDLSLDLPAKCEVSQGLGPMGIQAGGSLRAKSTAATSRDCTSVAQDSKSARPASPAGQELSSKSEAKKAAKHVLQVAYSRLADAMEMAPPQESGSISLPADPSVGSEVPESGVKEEAAAKAEACLDADLVAKGDDAHVATQMASIGFDVRLCRDGNRKGKGGGWGLLWCEEPLRQGQLVVEAVLEDSCVATKNAERLSLGELAVRAGDRLVAVDFATKLKQMKNAMKSDDEALFQFRRANGSAGKKEEEDEDPCAPAALRGDVGEPHVTDSAAVHTEGGNEDDVENASAAPPRPQKDKRKKGTKGRKASRVDSDSDSPPQKTAVRDAAKGPSEKDERRELFHAAALRCERGLPAALRAVFGGQARAPPSGKHDLVECFARFAAVEALEADFMPTYDCCECSAKEKGRRTFASRRQWLWPPLPPLLTVQLKRFQRIGNGSKFEKSSQRVDIPAVLDVTEFVATEGQRKDLVPHLAAEALCTEPPPQSGASSGEKRSECVYSIYGLCVHQGASMSSGHYVAYVNVGPALCKEEWYGASDTHVWKCTRAEALKAEAYVAFYRREEVS